MQQVDTLILHSLIVTMDPAGTIIEDGGLAITGTSITAVGSSEVLEQQFQADQTIDAGGGILMPGLINAHVHSGDLLFRGLVPDIELEPWLEQLWVAEGEYVTPENMLLAVQTAMLEMIRGGITTALDMFWYPDIYASAAEKLPFRLITGPVYLTLGGQENNAGQARLEAARAFLDMYRGSELIRPCLMPHGTYTVAPDDLLETWQLAEEYDALLHIHLSETRTEVATVEERYGRRPPAHLDSLGMLSPRTILAHGVHLEQEEIELLTERGASLVHCPVSNLKLASGIAPVPALLETGVPVLLGTDGPASSNDLDLWIVLRFAATLHKAVSGDPVFLPAEQALRMVTSTAAEALGIGHLVGSLEPGKRADVILIDTKKPHLTPLYNVYSHLVYAAGRGDIETVLINGRIVLEKGKFTTIDEAGIIAEVHELGKNIAAFMAAQKTGSRQRTQ
ncbi:MAG: amidohydrolase [Anaerolineales bacterium]|nr:amidohydrolase [Anaerolineales bacterium]